MATKKKYEPEKKYRPCVSCHGTGSRPGALVRLMNTTRRTTTDALDPSSGENFRCGVCQGTGKVIDYGDKKPPAPKGRFGAEI